ncbi:Alpha/beta hydrolase family protein [Candidatus Fokinia solitaria]|uniref:Alpha/beta hydrolase family protein n=1 Tax=Candidatus Fokinia solitaria TaxID=1802984 RepID=A0A2U8BSK0_9RICK|nr:alpha/beta fold hydrolase [Candidatus Fokinia solitaria]AWD33334.1 Alpha/beta hydrolase family protein [Candidatus Fokinia solitaria]
MENVVIRGYSGKLDGYFHRAFLLTAPSVLILSGSPDECSMNNELIKSTFKRFANRGFSVLRYDHRGVGRSEGEFKKNIGELVDVSLAVDWLRDSVPQSSQLVVFGFSYGAVLALRIFMRRPDIGYFVLCSPLECKSDSNFVSPCPGPGTIIYPSGDSKMINDSTVNLYHRLSGQQRFEIRCSIVKDAVHDFSNRMDEFMDKLDDCITYLLDNKYKSERANLYGKRRKKIIENTLMAQC